MTEPARDVVDRIQPPEVADERTALVARLDFLRATVINKLAGLSDEQAKLESVEPSRLTAAGIVKHLTGVERFWFSIDFADSGLSWPWDDANPHGGFPVSDDDTVRSVIHAYVEECDRSRAVVRAAGLDELARADGVAFDLRYALIHMIEETARHCGHLDLLRERIDGQTGE